MKIDHVVLWVNDPLRSVEFYTRVVGLEPVRVDEFRSGAAAFPSVRISADTILDLMSKAAASVVDGLSGSDGSAGHPVNHVCLSMLESEVVALRARLDEAGIEPSPVMEQSFGAQGFAPRAFYFEDLDGNVLEARYY